MRPSFTTRYFLLSLTLLLAPVLSFAQGLDVASCPIISKRNNGNGQASRSAGTFYVNNVVVQNNAVATNVQGTTYQNLYLNPSAKTGDVNFKWSSATTITKLPVITRVWLSTDGVNGNLSAVSFGPPPPPIIVGQDYFVDYSFYGQNIPPAGKITLEFADPQTGKASFRCTYDLHSGASATEPIIDCSPTVTTQPSNQTVCGASSATFTAAANGFTAVQWQVSSDNTNWSNVSGADYSGGTTNTLTISNPNTYDGKYYRAVYTGNTGCGNTNTSSAILIAKPKPTAVFSGAAARCGTGTQGLSGTLTGTGPWSIIYTTNGGSAATLTNISTSTFNFSVSPSAASTVYAISSVSDAYCTNSSPAASVTINAVPTITANSSALSLCYSSSASTVSFGYTSSNSPDKYTLTKGTRAMSGFVEITNGTLPASPLTINIPAGTAAGTYDFNLYVTNSSTGCTSSSISFTITVTALPTITAGATSYSICTGSSTTLSVVGATSYSWTSNPAGTTSTASSLTVSPTTTTTYSVTGTANGCSTAAASTVTITVNAKPTISISAPLTSIITGSSASLTASGASTYSWSNGVTTVGTGTTIVVSPTTSTTYTVTGTNSNGCTNTASQLITVSSAVTVSITPSATTICLNGSVSLTASGASTYSWSPSTGLSATTGATVTASPTTTTTYTVTGTNGSGITGTSTVTVTVSNPVSSYVPDIYYCAADLTGSKNLTMTFSTSSAQNFTWDHSANGTTWSTTFNGNYNAPTGTSNSTSTSDVVTSPSNNDSIFRVTFTPSGCPALSYLITLHNITGKQIQITGDQTICSGGTPTTLSTTSQATAGSSASTITYGWEMSTVSATSGFTSIASTNSTSYSPGAVSVDTWYRLKVTSTSTNCAGPYYSNVVKVTAATAIGNNTLSVTSNCAAGGIITGAAPTGGTGAYTYTWQSSTTSSSSGFSTISNATSQSYTPSSIPTQTTWYKRLVSSGSCTNNTSTAIAIYPPITSGDISNGQTICSGSSLTALSTAPTGGDAASSFSYAWQSSTDNSSFSNISGQTASSYSAPTTTGTNYYRVVITRGTNCSVTSNSATISVNARPTVAVDVTSATICSGNSVTITASGASTYNWSPTTNLSPTTGAVVVASPTSTTTYTVTGTDQNGCTNTATSAITVNASPANPTITGSSNLTICSTSSANLNAQVGAGTYDWFIAPQASGSYQYLTPTAVTISGTYYGFAKSGSCYSPGYVTVTVTVNNVAAPSVAATTLQYCAPATADLTALQPVAATGTALQWHTVSSNPGAGNLVSSPSSVSSSGTYYLYAYSSGGNCYGPASSAVAVTINSVTNGSVSSTSATVCSPTTVNLNSLNNTSGSGNTYSWYNTNNPIAANLVSVPSAVSASGTYYLYVVNAAGCLGGASSGVNVTVNAKPSTAISSPASVCSGAARTITATTDATSPSYQWQLSSDGGTSWTNITEGQGGIYTGVTSATLSISNTTGLGGKYYRYTVTSSASCSSTSDAAILAEDATVSISSQPADLTVAPGATASFTVSSSGSPTYNVQWQISTDNGGSFSDITDVTTYAGSNDNTLVISTAALGQNGYQFRAVVSSCNTVTTNAATLTVTTCVAPTISGVSGTLSICSGLTTTLTASSAASTPTYKWYDASSGGNLLFTGTSYTTSALTSTTTYYVAVTNGSGCTSTSRTATTVTVNALPTISGVSGVLTVCSGVNTTLTASSSASTPTYNWYSASTGGSSLFTGAAYATAALTSTTTFYVAVTDGNSCTSSSRTATTVTVNALPTISSVSGTLSVCTGFGTTLTANSSASTPTYNWYSASTGGSPLVTGANLNTGALTSSTTYYVAVTDGNSCTSASRTATTVTVNALPTISGVSGTLSVCLGTGTTLTASSSASTPTYTWYDASTGGTLLQTGASYTTAALTSTTTYYIAVADGNGCTSAARTATTVTVNALPTISGVSGVLSICSGLTTTLTASSSASTPTYNWYSASTGGSSLHTGAAYTTAALTSTTTYYVAVSDGNGCTSASRTATTVTVNPLPTISGVSGTLSICSGVNTTLTASSSASTPTYNWYSASTGGASLFTGAAYTTAALTSTTTFYVAVTDGNSCASSSRTAATVTVNALPTISSVSGTLSVCTGFGTTLTANSSASTPTYNWYSASTGGSPLVTGANLNTGALTSSTTYYVAVTDGNSCTSASRTAATVTVNALPTISGVSGTLSVCSGTGTTLTASSSASTPTYTWYDASTGGTLLQTGASYTTAALTSTTTYYVAVADGNGCTSASRTATTVTVNALPTISGVTGTMSVCPGLTTTLTAASSASTPTYTWYDASTGGNLLHTGAGYTTSALTTTTNYYVSVTDGNGCTTTSRSLATVTVTPGPTISGVSGTLAVCSGLNTTLTAASSASTPTYNWYDASTNGNLLHTGAAYTTAALTSTSSFYVAVTDGNGCTSATRTASTVTVNPLPTISGVSGTLSICSGVSTTLTAASSASTPTYNWYDASTGGTLLYTGAAYTTAALTSTTTYYVAITDGNSCTSGSRTATTVTVNPLPTISGVSGTLSVCSGFGTTLTASSSASTPTYNWYDASTGGNLLHTGAAYTTAALTSTTSYYVAVTDGNSCTASSRTATTVTVNALPTISGVTGTMSICPGLTTTLTAASSASTPTYNWYDASTGGTLLHTGAAYTTAALTSTTNYYVSITDGNSCTSASRSLATVVVTAGPTISGVTGTLSVCSGLNTTLTAASSASTPTFNWYDASSNGNLLYTGASYVTAALTSTTTFYVAVTDGNGCTSATRTGTAVTVNALPTISGVSGTLSICSGLTTTLTAASSVSTPTYNWYDASTGGTLLHTGAAYTTSALTSTTNYYISVTDGNSCTTASRTTATVTVNPLPTISGVSGTMSICSGLTTTLTAASSASTPTFNWYDASTGGTLLHTGAAYTTAALTSTTSYYVSITDGNSCIAASRTAATVTVNPLPTISGVTGTMSICPGLTTTLTAASSASTPTFNWYSASTGGTLLYTGAAYTTAALTSTTNYYVAVTDGNGCVAGSRTNTTVTVTAGPTISGVSGTLAVCAGLTTTLTASSAASTPTFNWYDASSSGNLLYTGAVYTTAALTSTTTYYVAVTDGNGCTSATRTSSTVTVNALPTISGVSGTLSVCSGLGTTVTANSSASTPTYNWYDASTGGNLLHTGAAYTTSALTSTTNYYVVITDGNSCTAASRTAATVTVNPLPTISGVSGVLSVCSGLGTTLTANSSASTPTYNWYDASTGGNLLHTGAAYTTAALTSTTGYYVSVTDANSCTSAARTLATVTVNPLPTISGVSGTMTICSGLTTTLTAASSASTPTYNWYDASTGGNLLYTGAAYTTAALTSTTTYYVAVTDGNSCTTGSRTLATVTVNALPTISGVSGTMSICSGLTTTLTATSSASTPTYNWYDASTGGTLLHTGAAYTTAALTSTANYYISVTDGNSCTAASRTTATVTVNPLPTISGITGSLSICSGTGTTLTAASSASTPTYNWYDASTGGALLHTGAAYATAALTSTTNYYVSVTDGNGCTAISRSLATVTVNPLPTISGVSGILSVCSGLTTTLTAASSASTPTYNWYDASTGGNLLFTGAAYTTAALTSTTNYYVSVTDGNGCTTASRTTATVTVNALPTISGVSGTLSICSGLTTTLTAASSASTPTYNWYDASTGGTLLYTGAAYTTSALTSTTSYYISVSDGNGCVAASRTTSTVTVNALPTISGVSGTLSICSGTTTTLTAASAASTPTYNWYNASTGGTLLYTGAAYATSALTSTTNYYVSVTDGNSCTAASRTLATVNVNALPTISGVSGTMTICSGLTTTLTAVSSASTPTYNWYDASTGGTLLHTGAAYTTAALTSTVNYYISVTDGNGCTAASRTTATVTVNPLPTISGVTGTLSICSGTGTTLTAASSASTPTYNWYDASTGGALLYSGAAYATSALTSTTTYYVSVTDGNSCAAASRTAATVTVNALPTISGVSGTMSICSGLTTTLTAASAASTPTYNWYSASTGGTLLYTGVSYTTAALTSTTNYYIAVTDGNGCLAASRTAATVTVNALPTISGVSGTLSICFGGTTTLTAASAASTPTYNWYDASAGGTLLYTGAAYTTVSLTSTTNYYVSVTDGNSCSAASRTTATVTVNPLPTISGVSGSLSICSGTTTTLTAASSASTPTYNWYDASTGGVLLHTGGAYTTAALTSTTNYYVSVTDGNSCTATSRTLATVTVNALPTISGVSGTLSICSGFTTTLTAASSASTPTYNWYDASTSGILLHTGAAYTTSALTATTTYYISVTDGNSCTAASRTSTTVTVNALPTIGGVSGTMSICSGLTTTLTAASSASTPTYNWYSASTGGTLLNTGVAYTTAALTSTTNYYVSVTDGNNCTASSRTAATVTVNPLPTIGGVSGTLSICSGLTTTLIAASSASTPTFNWYDASTGGTLLQTGTAYTTAALTSTTNYYISVTDGNSCTAVSRTLATVTVNPLPTISGVSGTLSICSGTTTTLTAASAASTPTYNWYSAPTGGTLLYTGAAYTTAALTSTTNYYVSVTDGNSCTTASRTAATVTVNALPTISGVSGTMSICSGLTTTLTAASSASTPTYNWYSASTGGTLLYSGAVYTTAALTSTTNYYVSVTDGNSCTTASRTAATVTVKALPTISGVSGTMSICSGLTTTLTVASSASTPTYNWYDASTGGILLYTGAAYTTSALTSTTTYYISVTDGNSCAAASRTAATVTVNALPAISGVNGTLSICSGLTTTLTAASSASTPTYNWYDASTGGALLHTGAVYTTSALTSTTNFYVAVTDGNGCTTASRTIATVNVNALPTISGVSGTMTICSGLTTTLTAASSASTPTYNWYDASTGGNLLYAGAAYTTAALTSTTTYYVAVTDGNSCTTASRRLATVTVNALPTISGVSGTISICSGLATTLTAASSAPIPTYSWYDASTGGALLYTGAAYTTAALTSTTNYYVSVTDGNNCTAASRTAATVTVNALPTISGVSGTMSICSGLTTTLTAASSASTPTYNWYSASTGGTLLNTGAAYTTAALTSTTSYYVSVTDGNSCTTTSRTAATVIVNALPTISGVSGTMSICSGLTTTLTAASTASTPTYNWYSASTGGTLLNTGAAYTTAALTSTTSYYVSVTDGNSCTTTSRTAVTVAVNALPAISGVSGTMSICSGLTTTLTAASSASTPTYNWYSASTGGTLLRTGAAYTTSALTSTTTYYVSVTDGNGCTASTRAPATVTVNALPTISSVTGTLSICSGLTTTLTAHSSASTPTFSWYDASTGGVLLNTGASYTTAALTTTTNYYISVADGNGCTASSRYTATVTMSSLPTISSVSGTLTVCTGESTTLSANSSASSPTFKWYDASTGGNLLYTGASMMTNALTSTTSYYVAVTNGGGCTSVSRTTATVTVNARPTISSVSGTLTICSGLTTTLTAASSASTPTYKWYNALTGGTLLGTGASYTTAALTNTTTYYVAVTDANSCASDPRTSKTVTVNPLPAISGVTGTLTICSGQSTTLTAASAASTPTFNWYAAATGGTPLATTAGYTTSALTGTTTFYVSVTSGASCVAASRTASTVTVNALPTIGITPTSVAINIGQSSTLTASGATSYAWTPTTSTSAGVTVSPITTTTYTVTGTDANSCSNTASAIVTVNTVLPFIPGSVSTDQTICSGTAAASLVSATDASGGTGTISYQWQQSADNTSFNDISAATGISYDPGTLTQTTYFRRRAVTSSDAAIYSNTVKITVMSSVSGIISGGAISVCASANSGTLSLTGYTGTIVKWQSSTDGFTTSADIANTTASLTYNNLTGNTQYRAIVQSGSCAAATTAPVTINIIAIPVTAPISGPCALPRDSSGTYRVNASANATRYVWTLPNGWQGVSTTNAITVKAISGAGNISVTAYNGDCASATVRTYPVTIIDYAKVTLSANPVKASGNGTSRVEVKIQLIDINGNNITCSGGVATFCANTGTYDAVVDHGDGTYTANLTSTANSPEVCGTVAGIPIQKKITVTFTGPQGGIKPNGPILATEIPKLTFTATEGVGPYTVIYRAAGASKNDTLLNVQTGVARTVPNIDSSKLYTLVSVIDNTTGERRNSNFIRDTATVVVLAPKIVLTMHSDAPVQDKDSTWKIRLSLKVKNIGDLDLSGVQVKLNLKDVFPSPVQYVLDSVRVQGSTVVANQTYDGIQYNDLFSKLKTKSTDYLAMNDVLSPATAGGMIDGESASGDRAQHNVYSGATADASAEHSEYMFGALSQLPVGVDGDMFLYLHIKPFGYTQPFVMQAISVGTGHTEEGTALTSSLSNDNDITTHPDISKKGDPMPTVITLVPNPVLGVAMAAGTPVDQGNGTYNVKLSYRLKNYGNTNLQTLKLYQNLASLIPGPAQFSIAGAIATTGTLVANPTYNGQTDTSLLVNSELGFAQEGTVTFTINIKPNQFNALYRLQAIGEASTSSPVMVVRDLSTDGTDPDPDGDQNPSEKVITVIAINQPIPPLKPGTIGILVNPTGRITATAQSYCAAATGVKIIGTTDATGGSGPYQYQWQRSTDGASFTDIAGATDSIYTTGTVTDILYLRRKTISDAQVAFTNAVKLMVYTVTKPVIAWNGNPVLPMNGWVTLKASDASTYSWSTSANTNAITVTLPGVYSVTVTDANGCTAASDPVTIKPPPPVTVNATYIIGGLSNPANSGVQVTAMNGAVLNFYILSSGGTLIPVPVLPGKTGTYTYYVSETLNGQESTIVAYTVTMIDKVADVQKTLTTPPTLQADGSFVLGFNIKVSNLRAEPLDSVMVKDDLSKVFPAGTLFEIASMKVSGSLIANGQYNGSSQTDLLAAGSKLAGMKSDSVQLMVKFTPKGFAGTLNNIAELSAKSPYGVFKVNSNDPTVGDGMSVRNPTKFTIPAVDIFIPSGFSPNHDGINDVFVITHPFTTGINLEVYNRWGNLVFRSADYRNEFDGRGNQPNNILGNDLPDGTYYYIVLATDKTTGAVRKFAGALTLKR